MKMKQLCESILEKALTVKELTLTRSELREYSPNTVRIEMGRVMKKANVRQQFKIQYDDETLSLTNKHHEGESSQLSGVQQMFTSIITEKHSLDLITCYLILMEEQIVESTEIRGVTSEELKAIYPLLLENVELIDTQKGTLLL